MTSISEYGEILISTYLDEEGFRKIDGVMEDGRRVLATAQLYYQQMSVTEIASSGVKRKTGKTFTVTEPALVSLARKGTWYRTLTVAETAVVAVKRKTLRLIGLVESSLTAFRRKTVHGLAVSEISALGLTAKGLYKRALSVVESAFPSPSSDKIPDPCRH